MIIANIAGIVDIEYFKRFLMLAIMAVLAILVMKTLIFVNAKTVIKYCVPLFI